MTGRRNAYLPPELCRRWLPSLRRTEEIDAPALLCVPYVGGNAGAFQQWQPRLGTGVRVLPLQFPGRWTRLREPPVEDMRELVETISSLISSAGLQRYSLYGHSFGALIAYEVVQLRVAQERELPEMLFVAAHPPPKYRPPSVPIHHRTDEEFLDALSLLDRPLARAGSRHFDRTLQSLKVDFRLSHDYEPSSDLPVPVPITAVTGRSDLYVAQRAMKRWAQETTEWFGLMEVEGDHFFVHDPPAVLLDAVHAVQSRETR